MIREELAFTIGPDNKIYAIGGYGSYDGTDKYKHFITISACLNTVERYDPVTGVWDVIAPMNECRRALAAVTLPDGIYAIGGYNGKKYLDSVER